MIKLNRRNKRILTALAPIVVILVGVAYGVRQGSEVAIETQDVANTSPPPAIVYTSAISDCTLEVSNYLPDGRRSYGHGVVLQHNGETFVLTSTMIFTHEGDITVGKGRFTYTAEIACQDDDLGLVALKCNLREGTSSVEVTDLPSIPPGVAVQVDEGEVNTLEYMNDYWVMLDGSLSVEATGMPVVQDNELVGIIVGLNRVNTKQAIMVGNQGIREFVDELTRPEPVYEDDYEDDYTADEDLPFGGFFRNIFGG
jgi:hypothetical protein